MTTDQLYDVDWIEFYDKLFSEKHYRPSFGKLLRLIYKYNPSAKNVLEFACGTGKYTRYFAKHGFHVKGVDISSAAIYQAKQRVPSADFHVADMAKFKTTQKFDVIACMFESFRYHKSFSEAQKTLKKAYASLKQGGIFFCDFGVFPSCKKPKKPQIHNEVKISNGRLVVKDEIIYTKGDFDVRFDHVKVFKRNRKGESILLMEKDIRRSPLLRISESKMEEMLEKVGFSNIKIMPGFSPAPHSHYSILFFGQRL